MAVAHSERIAIRRGTDRAREARDIAAARAPPPAACTTLSAWISVHRPI
jgi:hypothetical protein